MILPHSLCPDSEIFWPFEVRGVYRVSGQIPSPRSQVPGPRFQVPGAGSGVPDPLGFLSLSFSVPSAFLEFSFMLSFSCPLPFLWLSFGFPFAFLQPSISFSLAFL